MWTIINFIQRRWPISFVFRFVFDSRYSEQYILFHSARTQRTEWKIISNITIIARYIRKLMIVLISQLTSDGDRISLFFFSSSSSPSYLRSGELASFQQVVVVDQLLPSSGAARFLTFIVLRLKPYTMGDKADVYCFPRCRRRCRRRNDNASTQIQRTREIKIAEPAKLYNNNSNNNITTHNESTAAMYIVCTTAKHTAQNIYYYYTCSDITTLRSHHNNNNIMAVSHTRYVKMRFFHPLS